MENGKNHQGNTKLYRLKLGIFDENIVKYSQSFGIHIKPRFTAAIH